MWRPHSGSRAECVKSYLTSLSCNKNKDSSNVFTPFNFLSFWLPGTVEAGSDIFDNKSPLSVVSKSTRTSHSSVLSPES